MEFELNICLLIIWIINGILIFIAAFLDKEHRVPWWSYAFCWLVLILELIKNIIK